MDVQWQHDAEQDISGWASTADELDGGEGYKGDGQGALKVPMERAFDFFGRVDRDGCSVRQGEICV